MKKIYFFEKYVKDLNKFMLIDELNYFLDKSQQNKSSHWNKNIQNQDFHDIFGGLGYGTFTRKNFFMKFIHSFFQKKIFDTNIFISSEHRMYKKIFDQINRQIDICTLRHIFTFNYLNKQLYKNKITCVIGDGKANFTIGAINLFPNTKIFSVNLPEVLINDYLILKKFNIINDNEIIVVKSEDDIFNEDKSLYLIPASNAHFCMKKNIDLFINIAGFQEMTIDEIDRYFKIIKSNNSLFYCCNREYKKLDGGEELIFDDYPWGIGKKLLYEDCNWHQKLYSLKPPFVNDYDGNHKHCLIDYRI